MAERNEKAVEPVSKQDTRNSEIQESIDEPKQKPQETEPLFKDWAMI